MAKKKVIEGYAVNSINLYLSILSIILQEAVRVGYIERNPCTSVIKFSDTIKKKGILSENEIKILFSLDHRIQVWDSEVHFLVNYTAIHTGCRVGEILALTADKFFETYIEVSSSYDRKYGLKSTKNKETRFVPIPKYLFEMLYRFNSINKGKFIFSLPNNYFKPISYSSVNKAFKKALEKIGITEECRRNRSITFHSYRHYFNTRLRESGLPDAVTRKIIGHKSSSMTENYSHIETRLIDSTSFNIFQKN